MQWLRAVALLVVALWCGGGGSPQPPPLEELASTWQSVKTCNDAGERRPCGAANVTAHDCVNHLACCWSLRPQPPGSPSCYRTNEQHETFTPGVPTNPVARYAVAQGIPSLANTVGSAQVSSDGDVLGVDCMTFPPLSQSCYARQGDSIGTPFGGNVHLNGAHVAQAASALRTRWKAYEVERVSTLPMRGGPVFTLASRTRLQFARQELMSELSVSHSGSATANVTLSFSLASIVRNEGGQQWWWIIPQPENVQNATTDLQSFTASEEHGVFVTRDSASDGVSVAGFTTAGDVGSVRVDDVPGPGGNGTLKRATITAHIAAGHSLRVQLRLVVGVGSEEAALLSRAHEIGATFDAAFLGAKTGWATFWRDSFDPSSAFPEGNAPVLVTQDAQLRRTYYMAVLSFLMNARRSAHTANRTLFVNSGPSASTTNLYLWDTCLNSVLCESLEGHCSIAACTRFSEASTLQTRFCRPAASRAPGLSGSPSTSTGISPSTTSPTRAKAPGMLSTTTRSSRRWTSGRGSLGRRRCCRSGSAHALSWSG